MTVEFTDIKAELELETTEDQKALDAYGKITKHNTNMFERIKSFGSEYDQQAAYSLIELLTEVETLSPLPQSRKLIEDYIVSSGLKVTSL
ncbi:hypothetical protein [Pseudoalteromonas sp. SR41-1]|uniref:hypothetical protein n=1 Tax=Pseudoalteromonas sp. SR41-1 TaxID=2760952 RepID=UPI0015FF7C98|nr:hypothetical protein [Pseudoalteromonas sp. SR41-1]MBB1279102.1 hypothetical protein [Pseudoalteromonas sp. SR41-1]